MSASISVDRKTKDSPARQERAMEASGGLELTWDQFFERALVTGVSPENLDIHMHIENGHSWQRR